MFWRNSDGFDSYLNQFLDDIFTSFLHILPVDVNWLRKDPVPLKELSIRPSKNGWTIYCKNKYTITMNVQTTETTASMSTQLSIHFFLPELLLDRHFWKVGQYILLLPSPPMRWNCPPNHKNLQNVSEKEKNLTHEMFLHFFPLTSTKIYGGICCP